MHIDTAITYENIQSILEIATNKTPTFTLRLCSCPAYAHSPTEWNICLIIKQTVNKSALFTKRSRSTGSLHYKELCKEQGWPGGFLSPPLESYSKWKQASSPWAQQEPTHIQSRHSQGCQRAALACSHCICAILPVTAVSADP